MSAFVVSDKVISIIVLSFIPGGHYARKLAKAGYDFGSDDTAQRLANDLMALNVRAVNERYGENEKPRSVRFTGAPTGHIQIYKQLECLIYQCSEGTVPESPLYKLMDEIKNYMASQIVADLPEYKRIGWGD